MLIEIATLFPDMCEAVLSESIIGRARKKGALTVRCHQIRDYTLDKHRRVDDAPFGGGMGLVMQAQPIYDCWKAVAAQSELPMHTIYMSPKGKTLTQQRVRELAEMPRLFLLCGHYEGVDQRVLDTCIDEEISIGDYILTGGELAAMVLVDCVSRFIPGVLGSEESPEEESFSDGLLEYPQYTRPREWNGMEVPEVLLSGNHAKIREWRRQQSLLATQRFRPDLFEKAELTVKEKKWMREVGLCSSEN